MLHAQVLQHQHYAHLQDVVHFILTLIQTHAFNVLKMPLVVHIQQLRQLLPMLFQLVIAAIIE